ncbi:MAG: hypothetical protein ABI680_17555 [Chthoniobacteraceae bacterium]
MKTNSSLRLTGFFIALASASLFAFGSCASTSGTTGKAKQALVCPQCKMVALPNDIDPDYPSKHTVYRDACPNCQGAITTLFKDGKLKHKCSACEASPFTCPLYHR